MSTTGDHDTTADVPDLRTAARTVITSLQGVFQDGEHLNTVVRRQAWLGLQHALKTAPPTYTLSPDLEERLTALADRFHACPHDMVEQAVEDYIARRDPYKVCP